MIINTYLYKNKILIKKHLNINVRYDKNMHSFEFNEEKTKIQVTFDENQIEYIRYGKDYDFYIKHTNQKSQAKIKFKEKEFLIIVLKSSYKKTDHKIYLSYIIETDNDNENEIIIEFFNKEEI